MFASIAFSRENRRPDTGGRLAILPQFGLPKKAKFVDGALRLGAMPQSHPGTRLSGLAAVNYF
jgi:hypothetical protein